MNTGNRDHKERKIIWVFIFQNSFSFLLFCYLLFIGGGGDNIANSIFVYRANIILFTLMFIAWLCYPIITAKRSIRPRYIVFIQLFLAVTLLSVLFSINFWQSINEYFLWGFYFFILFGIINIIHWGWKDIHLLYSFLIVGGLHNLIKVFLALQWLIAWISNTHQGLAVVLRYRTRSPNQTAAVANLILFVALALFIGFKDKGKRGLQLYLIISSIFVVILSSSRGGIIGLVAGIGTIFIVRAIHSKAHFIEIWHKHKVSILILGLAVIILFSGRLMFFPDAERTGLEGRFGFWEVAIKTFLQNPILGSGLYTMGNKLFVNRSVPPGDLHAHAHNIFLNILGEIGFAGFVAFVLSLVFIVNDIYKKYRWDSNHIALGALGAMVAFLTHGLVDTFVEPNVVISVIVICSIALAPTKTITCENRRIIKSESVWFIGMIIILGWILLFQRLPVEKAILNSKKSEIAIEYFTMAIKRKPGWALGYQQRAIMTSFLASADENEEKNYLNLAIQDFEEAIELDPSWAANYANIGALYAADGNYDLALESLEQALRIAPDSALFHLNMAGTAELSGEKDLAEIHYWNYLLLQDNWDLGPFWRDTPVRQSIYYKVRKMRLIDIEPAKSVEDLISSLEPGAYNSEIYLHMSERYYDLGEYRLAQDALRIAELGISESTRLYPDLLWNKARINVAEGNYDKGLDYAQSALNRWRFQSSEGPGTYGNSKYGERLFRSPTIDDDLVAQFTIAPFPASWIDRLVTTGKWYLEINKTKDAEEIFLEVLEYDSDHSEASSLLSELK